MWNIKDAHPTFIQTLKTCPNCIAARQQGKQNCDVHQAELWAKIQTGLGIKEISQL